MGPPGTSKSFQHTPIDSHEKFDQLLNEVENQYLKPQKLLKQLKLISDELPLYVDDKNINQLIRIIKIFKNQISSSQPNPVDRIINEIEDRLKGRVNKFDKGKSLLHKLADNGDFEGVRALTQFEPFLIDLKSEPSGRTAFDYAKDRGHLDIMACLNFSEALLTIDAHKKFDQLLNKVENQYLDSNTQLWGPLNLISFKLPLYVDDKNINQLIRIIKIFKNQNSSSRVNEASSIIKKIKKIEGQLLEQIKIFDRGRNLLHKRAVNGDFKGVRTLTQFEPSLIDLKSEPSGRTAFDYAKDRGHLDIMAYLNLPPALRNKEIVYKKEEKGQTFKLKGLLASMQALNLKIEESFRYRNVIYHFTRCFKFQKLDRIIIYAFVEHTNKLYPRLFWLSNSQCVWRRVDKVFADWIGKTTKGEEYLSIPINVNLKVFDILKKGIDQNLDEEDIEDLCKRVVAWSERNCAEVNVTTPLDAESPDGTSGIADDKKVRVLRLEDLPSDPALNDFINVDNWQRPNFKSCEMRRSISSPFYGNLVARAFLSYDKTIRFLFLENTNKQVFLAGAEVVGGLVTIRGLNAEWIKLGSLSLPLLEYREQFVKGFLTTADHTRITAYEEKNGRGTYTNYVMTWNYLQNMPVIRQYYREINNNFIPRRL